MWIFEAMSHHHIAMRLHAVAFSSSVLVRLLALMATLLLLPACASQPSRCDRRPNAAATAEDSAREKTDRQRELAGARASYARGLDSFKQEGREKGESSFTSMVGDLNYLYGGELLFEEDEDGHWVYRCDDLTRLYALAATRLAVVYGDFRERADDRSAQYLCVATRMRPDVVQSFVREEGFSPKMQRLLQKVMRDPLCYFEDGWRSGNKQRPIYTDYSFDRSSPE